MGGSDDPSNLVKLTVQEHAQAHKELYEKHGHWQDKLAYEGLSGQIGKDELMTKLYKENGKANAKKFLTDDVRKKAVENARKTNKGRKLSPEHLAKTRTWGMKQSEYQKKQLHSSFR